MATMLDAMDLQVSHRESRFCEPDAFKAGMRLLMGGVCLICTSEGERFFGLTATAVCSVSASPPMLLTCVNREGSTYSAIRRSGIFSVNLLSGDHDELALAFSRPSDVDRFAAGEWKAMSTGAPVLNQALTSFDCRLLQCVEAGTHGILIGAVVDVATSKADALGYRNGSFFVSRQAVGQS
jgi:flavin reductase (DIM6/NTAB) family NADH-FMN oxidoreductase RutF